MPDEPWAGERRARDTGRTGWGAMPVSRRTVLQMASLSATGVVLAGCSSSKPVKAPVSKVSAFPLGAAAHAKSKPVNITMWQSMTGTNGTALADLTAKFNASQSDVHVSMVNQASYTATLTLYTAALSGGTLPDVVQMESSDLQLMIDSDSATPVQSAIDAENYSLSDYVPSTVDYFRVDGALWALPFAISGEVLFYNKVAFSKAGLDPESPPTTLSELRAYAEKIVSTRTEKYGMSLKLTPSTFEEWMAMGGELLVNHGNGRSGRATAVTFDDSLGKSLFTWWYDMVHDKIAQTTPFLGYDDLYAIASQIAPMTIETSAAIGDAVYVLDSHPNPNLKLGVGPLPGPSAPNGGVFVGGSGLYIVKLRSTPERQDAAWQYIKFLQDPTSQAYWAAKTGYIPVRRSAVSEPVLTQAWKDVPQYRVAYEQILASPANPATAGYVSGASTEVDTAIENGLTALSSGVSPGTALAQAAHVADTAISSYNSRV
ncbi:MAG: ABC transporter substrate-binding protein [Actinobacteria bacterium]|nr:ABC transporter substrate-binding protein [Actinomycetota bacterium]MCL5446881.1 ABC transporter substrate-binding protein [Actinomycetota bacterium]